MFELCTACEDHLRKFNKKQYHLRKDLFLETEWVKHLAQTDFSTSRQADERLAALGLSVSDISDFFLTIVEIQSGFYDGDYKFIYRAHNGLHVVFLYSQGKPIILLNIYNPLEGKNLKWNPDGTQRIYLESFTNCCPQPE